MSLLLSPKSRTCSRPWQPRLCRMQRGVLHLSPHSSLPLDLLHDRPVRSPLLECRSLRYRSRTPRCVACPARAGIGSLGGLATASRPLRQAPASRSRRWPPQSSASGLGILLRLVSTPICLLPILRRSRTRDSATFPARPRGDETQCHRQPRLKEGFLRSR